MRHLYYYLNFSRFNQCYIFNLIVIYINRTPLLLIMFICIMTERNTVYRFQVIVQSEGKIQIY